MTQALSGQSSTPSEKPLALEFSGVRHDILDWSPQSVRIHWDGAAAPEPTQQGQLIILDPEGQVMLPAAFELVSHEAGLSEAAFHIQDVSARGQALLQAYYEGRAPEAAVPQEDAAPRKLPLQLKPMIMAGLYMTLGLSLIVYVTLLLNANFVNLEVQTAVVSAPVQPLHAPADGIMVRAHNMSQELMQEDALLISFSQPDMDQAIALTLIKVERATLDFSRAVAELDAERARNGDYRDIAQRDIDRLKSQADIVAARLDVAQRQLNRFTQILKDGWTTESVVDEKRQAVLELKQQAKELDHRLKERREALRDAQEGRYFSGNRIEGRIAELEAEVTLAREDVFLARQELQALEDRKARLQIRAPADGRMVRLHPAPGSFVKQGETIGFFEREEDRTLLAFLNQEEALEVGLGDQATAYFPALDREVPLRVLSIDRTTSYLQEMTSRYEWRGPEDRAAIVTLRFDGLEADDIRRNLTPGLPAVVVFKRRQDSALWNRLFSGFDIEI